MFTVTIPSIRCPMIKFIGERHYRQILFSSIVAISSISILFLGFGPSKLLDFFLPGEGIKIAYMCFEKNLSWACSVTGLSLESIQQLTSGATNSEILNLKAEIAFIYLGDDLDVILESHKRGAGYARLCRDFLVEGVADHSIQIIPV